MDRKPIPSPARSNSTAGVVARAILATSKQQAMLHAAGAAKVGLALTRRSGHVVVTGPDDGVAAALMRATESQLGGMRLVRESAGELEVDQLLRSLRDASPTERIAAVVTDADRLDVASLQRLHAGLDSVALQRGDVRLVLVGGGALLRTLRDARLRDLMARVCLQLDVPAVEDIPAVEQPDQAASIGTPERLRTARIGRFEFVAIAVAVVVGIALWTRLDPGAPPSQPRPDIAAAPTPLAAGPAAITPAPRRSDPQPVATSNDAPSPSDEQTPVIAARPIETPSPVEAPPAIVAPPAIEAPPAVEAAPAADTVVAHTAPVSSGSSLQVGAFASAENATRLAARLRPRFDRVEVTKIVRGTRTLHRVRIGGFTSETERRTAARRLAAEGLEALPVR